jgi:hypothetical protein
MAHPNAPVSVTRNPKEKDQAPQSEVGGTRLSPPSPPVI